MKITCLIENTSSLESLHAEHGLSLFIEANGKKILFDMGQSSLFSENASKLGINLSDINFAVLSHGHYDHGGGLKKFLEINVESSVYLSKYAFEPHFNGTEKYIGLDTYLNSNGRLVFTDDITVISKGLTLYSCNSKNPVNEIDSGGLTKLLNDRFMPDDFLHEQYLLIEENGKKILVSGCSHKGIINLCEWFKPDILIGGFHFSKYPLDEKLEEFANKLNKYETYFFTCHCTGTEQFNFMNKFMKNLSYLSTGQIIKI